MTIPVQIGTRRKKKANWIGRYLVVEELHASEIRSALLATAEDTFRLLEALPDKGAVSQQARKAQYRSAMKQVRQTLHESFGIQDKVIRKGRKAAAVAAVEAKDYEDLEFLTRLAPSKAARDAWMAQRKVQAARNVEAVAARVLWSQRPLSKNVWSAEAISKGYVNKLVNVGLARGDSAQDIAKRVRGLIHPDVPGGVSYASMRLARTEINNAFHAQSIMDMQESPWVDYVEWHFSKTHEPQGCVCEVYEQMQYFPKEQIPSKPHPQCRCYITAAKITDEEFEQNRNAGQYRLIEDQMEAMEPAPREGPTTKASQPEGWTGPLVSKDAQNKSVAGQTNFRWLYEVDADAYRRQAAREGSRIVQTKGYRGGLPTAGKKALLEQEYTDEKLAEHIGKELTARLAYSEPSRKSVYRVVYLDSKQLEALKDRPNVSVPLSTFENDMDKLEISAAGSAKSPVVLEVQPGAKVTGVGDSSVTMGTFKIDRIEDVDGTPVLKLAQTDIREHEAPLGKNISDLELVYGDLGEVKVPDPPKPKPKAMPKKKTPAIRKAENAKAAKLMRPKHDATEVARKIDSATSVTELRDIMKANFPDVEFKAWQYAGSLEQAKGTADAVNDMLDRFPVNIVSKVGFDNPEVKYGSGYENTFAVCFVDQTPLPNTLSDLGIPAKRWQGEVTVNTGGPMRDVAWGYNSSIDQSFHPTWANKTHLTEREATRSIVTHELGHALDDRLMYSLRDNAGRIVYEAFDEYKDANPGTSMNIEKFIKMHRPSTYSMDPGKAGKTAGAYSKSFKINPPEFVAEAVADVVGNGYDRAALLSQHMWDFITDEWKRPRVFLPGKGDIPDPEFFGS